MVNEQVLKGHWTELRGRLKEKWGSLTDHDLGQAEEGAEVLVGVIQRRTGESREKIEHELDQITQTYDSTAENLRRKASETLETASQRAREFSERARATGGRQMEHLGESYEHLSAEARQRYHEAENTVRRHPLESIGIAFGAGLLTGLCVGLCFVGTRR